MGEIHRTESKPNKLNAAYNAVMADQLKPYQFKPGQSGNPGGKAPLSDEERSMRDNFKKSFAMLGNKTIEEIEALAKDKSQPAPIAIAAKALSWAFKSGNAAMYREIWDRTIGKVAQPVLLSGNLEVRPYKEMSDDELRERIEKLARGKTLPTGKS